MNHPPVFEPFDEFNRQLRDRVAPENWPAPDSGGRYHLVVVGAGTAGLVAAAAAAGMGARVALVERRALGGDCLNLGCVPSKALLASARVAATLRSAAAFGVSTAGGPVDFGEVMRRMRRLRAEISPHDSAQRFRDLGVDVFFGDGTFVSGKQLDVDGRALTFSRALIATGSRAAVPPVPGLDRTAFLTHETLFSLTELPRRLTVLGGGPVGCEMAQAFARFGSRVTVVESASRPLFREDPEAAILVQQSLERDGVQFLCGAEPVSVKGEGEQQSMVVRQKDRETTIAGDALLVATGRTPNLEGLGLAAAGVASDPLRGVLVNDRMQTANRRIFAAGDVCSPFRFTHAADHQARLVVRNALFAGRSRASRLVIPWCTFTSPGLAHVGLQPAEAGKEGIRLHTLTQPFSEVDRARLDGSETGFVRVHCRPGSDRIVGATVVAEDAGELIGELTLAIQNGIGLKKIGATIHPYPTLADAIRKLGDQYQRTRLTPFVKSLAKQWLRWI